MKMFGMLTSLSPRYRCGIVRVKHPKHLHVETSIHLI